MDPKKKPQGSDKIEKLEKEIYSRDFSNKISERSSLSTPHVDVHNAWEGGKGLDFIPESAQRKQGMSLFKKIFIGSLIFFLLSAAVAVYAFFGGFNIISATKVNISFVGPVSIAAGDPLSFDVVIDNKNNLDLTNAVLYIDFPDGTKEASDITQDLLHEKDTLGDIPIGGSARQTVKMVLFGAERDTKSVQVKLEYAVKNSNATFTKQKSYDVQLTSSPLTMTVSHPTEVQSNQDLVFNVNVVSNSSSQLTNLLLQVAYPFGFEFLDATPTPSTLNTNWNIPKLDPGQHATFQIHGRIVGQEGDIRVLRFAVGEASASSSQQIGTAYLNSSESVTVRKPPLGLKLTLNDEFQQPITTLKPGQSAQAHLLVTNNLSTQALNAHVQIVLTGNAVDPQGSKAYSGIYDQNHLTLSWDTTVFPQLSLLNPGATVELDSVLKALPDSVLKGVRNGTINAAITVTATTPSSTQVVVSESNEVIKIQPSINLIPRIVYSTGPFKNTGPVPPKVGQTTTYTVDWVVTAASDDMEGATVHAVLAPFVKWVGAQGTTTELTWNPVQNDVVWHIGTISGTNPGTPAKEISFQIEVTPTAYQAGTIPSIVSSITYQATDGYTQNVVTGALPDLTTSLPTDPKFQGTSGVVSK